MRKKLQIYNGIVAYKADKTPIKRAFTVRQKLMRGRNMPISGRTRTTGQAQ